MDTQILTAILSKDSKHSTYKYALLRAMVQCVVDQNPHKSRAKNGWISYPFGLLIYYWLLYYYPIFSSDIFIPQKNGETPELRRGNTIAFRKQFNKVIEYYRDRGGFAQFRFDLIKGSVPEGIQTDFIHLVRKIQRTIKNMPMKHLGYYQFGEHYSLVNYETETIQTPSYYGLVTEAGSFFMLPELYTLLDEVGSLIIGQDSIIDGWAEFTSKAAKRAVGVEPIPKEKMLSVLTRAVDVPRDTEQVKRFLNRNSEWNKMCVWTGKQIGRQYAIDHAIPYSLWQNNSLWNLFPTKSAVNSRKSDKIPTPELIARSAERITYVWKLYANSYGTQFEQEVFEGLGTRLDTNMDNAIQAMINKSEYLIEKRGFQKFDG